MRTAIVCAAVLWSGAAAAAPPLSAQAPVGPPKPTMTATEAAKNVGNLHITSSLAAVLKCKKSGTDSASITNTSSFPVVNGSTIDVAATAPSGTSHSVFTTTTIAAGGTVQPTVHFNPDFTTCTAKVTK